jgi:hypothetical protein
MTTRKTLDELNAMTPDEVAAYLESLPTEEYAQACAEIMGQVDPLPATWSDAFELGVAQMAKFIEAELEAQRKRDRADLDEASRILEERSKKT